MILQRWQGIILAKTAGGSAYENRKRGKSCCMTVPDFTRQMTPGGNRELARKFLMDFLRLPVLSRKSATPPVSLD